MRSGRQQVPSGQVVVYGEPVSRALPQALESLGASRVALVTSRSLAGPGGLAEAVRPVLGQAWAGTFSQVRAHAPRSDVVKLAAFLRECGADAVLSVGGGSVCSAAKVARLLLGNGVETVRDMDCLRAPAAVHAPALAQVFIPTTLSAGEYTSFAGSTDERGPLKETYYHPELAGGIVLLDPAMTLETPHDLWFSTAIRAVDHAVEAWCANAVTPVAEATSLHALRLLFAALERLRDDPADLSARLDAQIGAWLSIQGFAGGVDLGGSHAIGHALGGTAGMSHGHTSCVMLPHVLRYNAPVNGERQKAISQTVGRPERDAADLVRDLVARLGLPGRLRDAGLERNMLAKVADAAMRDPWIGSNPRPIDSRDTVLAILEAAW